MGRKREGLGVRGRIGGREKGEKVGREGGRRKEVGQGKSAIYFSFGSLHILVYIPMYRNYT